MAASAPEAEDWNLYAKSILGRSMVTGVPQIVVASNLPKKIIRSVMLCFCVGGFVWQAIQFLNIYWEYKTTVQVTITSPRQYEIPAITLCHTNGLLIDKLCDNMPEANCSFVSESLQREFCAKWPNFCPNGNPIPKKFPDVEWLQKKIYTLPLSDISEYLPKLSDQWKHCAIKSTGLHQGTRYCPYSNNVIVVPALPLVCYSLNTVLGYPRAPPRRINSSHEIWLSFRLPDKQFSNYQYRKDPVRITFHSPRTMSNPYRKGFSISRGDEVEFTFRKIEKYLQPAPYDTDCKDYLQEWKDRGGRGPTTKDECINECEMNATQNTYGCLFPYHMKMNKEATCDSNFKTPRDSPVFLEASECARNNCKPACREDIYEAQINTIKNSVINNAVDYDKRDVSIVLNLNDMETTTYTYTPRFQLVEVFSHIGGYIGIWLGTSLVAAFDVMETLVLLVKYPLNKMRQRRREREENYILQSIIRRFQSLKTAGIQETTELNYRR